ncbi:uncharacterized protein LOC114132480 isoform X2 [Aphis gossypii]|uniref:uncharacterized protein LOC114132480 isoform X2 n=1 Tax=Aphis gossypii TaxID=80765 RepID=UPI0021596A96|nr:uncharacterized protein LOC114132480 isoform X2 [Aphis gossypii]
MMNSKHNNDVECPTCRGLGKVPSNGDVIEFESKAFVHVGDQTNTNIASDFNNLKLLTEMDTIIGCVTDLLPEKAPLDNPKEVIKSVQTRLKNTNSEEHIRAISDAVQVARNHQKLLKPHINLINQKIVQFLNSQRIVYVRLACQSAGELFRTMRCTDRPLFDNIVTGLMNRTADKNQNIRIDANWALDKMVISIPPLYSITSIANCSQHKNPAIKIAKLRLMHCITVIADPIKILSGTTGLKKARQLILKTCIATIEDPNAEIRFLSKKLMQLLKSTCYESFCSSLVQDISWDELKIAEKNLNMEDLADILKKHIK